MAVRRVDVVQYGWNMFDRRMQRDILPYCAEHDVGFMAYGSLAFGLLTGTFTEDMDFGIRLDGFNDFQIGDTIECYTLEKVPQKL
jgi:aryl-alcohol dehydrogenase-like predicted oxidoreductase